MSKRQKWAVIIAAGILAGIISNAPRVNGDLRGEKVG